MSCLISFRRVGAPEKTPVLIISYELFRKHAAALNEVPKLDVIICDEGHRLKNSGGTMTIRALSDCKAKKRIVLTGTPVQNDLDELYAVVSFVAPDFFGSLARFKKVLGNPITQGQEPDATEEERKDGERASARLRALLAQIMMRRTQHDILRHSLPPRTDVVLHIALTAEQGVAYDAVADDLRLTLGLPPVASAEDGEEDDDDVDSKMTKGSGGAILPGLQKLRALCNVSIEEAGGAAEEEDYAEEKGALVPVAPSSSSSGWVVPRKVGAAAALDKENARGNDATKVLPSVAELLARSSKLHALDVLLATLRLRKPDEKAVIVSNFTSTLDLVEALARDRGYGLMRIDGSVPTNKRQSLVDCFNRTSDRRFLFLISSKAGGVGINLIGGSRLIMFDCDWNPAIDLQAMSRVWREGQQRPVFVYRLIAHGRIEDAILQRQHSKAGLASAVTQADAEGSDGGARGGAAADTMISLTKKDVMMLLAPRTGNDQGDDGDAVDAGDEVLAVLRGVLARAGILRRTTLVT